MISKRTVGMSDECSCQGVDAVLEQQCSGVRKYIEYQLRRDLGMKHCVTVPSNARSKRESKGHKGFRTTTSTRLSKDGTQKNIRFFHTTRIP